MMSASATIFSIKASVSIGVVFRIAVDEHAFNSECRNIALWLASEFFEIVVVQFFRVEHVIISFDKRSRR
jgi:hypothetical protein